MILDLERFQAQARPRWQELDRLLEVLEGRPGRRLTPEEAERLQELYAAVAADLNRVTHGSLAPELQSYLERLVARAYAEVYFTLPERRLFWQPRRWLRILTLFPETFRREWRCFALALALTVLGTGFGAVAVLHDPVAVQVLLPADYLRNPGARVQADESGKHAMSGSDEGRFASYLIQHNIQVALLAAALGVTFGLGTALLLFENGVLLGAVAAHYAQQGFGVFVTAWLLPHGALEIPAVLVAGQAGFFLARHLLRRGRRSPLSTWLILLAGVMLMLLWAGMMEGFFSQHQAPQIPYGFKIAIGAVELLGLTVYLLLAGSRAPHVEAAR